jgi:hypothetical protein
MKFEMTHPRQMRHPKRCTVYGMKRHLKSFKLILWTFGVKPAQQNDFFLLFAHYFLYLHFAGYASQGREPILSKNDVLAEGNLELSQQ